MSFFSFSPDSPVQSTHNCNRYVKGSNGCAESNIMIRFDKLYVTFFFWNRSLSFYVWPCVYPGRPQKEGNPPSTRWNKKKEKNLYQNIFIINNDDRRHMYALGPAHKLRNKQQTKFFSTRNTIQTKKNLIFW